MRDFHEDVIEFSLMPSEKCEVCEFIPSPRSGVASVQSLEERVDECSFGDTVALPSPVYLSQTEASGASASTASIIFPRMKHPRSVRVRRGMRGRECGFHEFRGGRVKGALEPELTERNVCESPRARQEA